MTRILVLLLVGFFNISAASGNNIMDSYIDQQASTKANPEKLQTTAKNLKSVFQAMLSGGISGDVANEKLYSIVTDNLPETVFILTLTNLSEDQLNQSLVAYNGSKFAVSLRSELDYISDNFYDFSMKISNDLHGKITVGTFLNQANSLDKLAMKTGLVPRITKENSTTIFFDYLEHIRSIKSILGYDVQGQTYDRTEYWPNADYFPGYNGIIDLFRSSEREKEKSIQFSQYFDALPQDDQLLLYAWVYDPSLEFFMSGARTPDDLPDWIHSSALKDIHRMVNEEKMAQFENSEKEMLDEEEEGEKN